MKKIIAFVVTIAPSMAFAQTTARVVDVNSLSTKILGIGSTIVYILVAAAVLFIVWNVVMYLIKGKGEEGRGAAGMNILWGIVGLFIIVSIWGLVNILTNTFGTQPTDKKIPNFTNNEQIDGIPARQVPIVQ